MGEIFDYSNMNDRVQEARDNRENKGKPFEEGRFKGVLINAELGKSQKGNKMFKLDFRVNCPESKRLHREKVSLRFTVTADTKFQVDDFVILMDDLGVDYNDLKKDRDWAGVFEQLEDERVKVVIEIYYKDDDKDDDGNVKPKSYPEMRIVEILKALPGATVEEEEDEKPKAKAKPKTKPAPKKEKEEEPKEEPAEEPVEEPEPENNGSGSDDEDEW